MRKIFNPQIFAGLRDTVGVLRELGGRKRGARCNSTRNWQNAFHSARGVRLVGTSGQPGGADRRPRWRAETKSSKRGLKLCSGTARSTSKNCCSLAPWLSPRGALFQRCPQLAERLAPTNQGAHLARTRRVRSISRPWLETPVNLAPASHLERRAGGSRNGRVVSREASDARPRSECSRWKTLARQSDELAAMDFTFLFDPARELFSIGFNVTERRRDASFYDLLASEARLCSYVTIAQGQVPQDHWFSLGRLLVAPRGEPMLVSWSGSMFEYLMPLLVMPNYENTLARSAPAKRRCGNKSSTARCAACRGASPNRVTTAPTCI